MNTANWLLTKLPPDELKQLQPHLDRVTFKQYDVLIKPGETIDYVVFPETCLASLVIVLEDGSTVEGGSVGREGMVGIPALLEATSTTMETLIQVGGEGQRAPVSIVKAMFNRESRFRTLLNRYVHTLFIVASQSAACNRRHQVEQRLARWLLMSSDGIGSNEVAITHEFLATMLGVRRSGVTEAAVKLQEAGMIQYKRGGVKIVDRPALERASCECYLAVKNEYERVFR